MPIETAQLDSARGKTVRQHNNSAISMISDRITIMKCRVASATAHGRLDQAAEARRDLAVLKIERDLWGLLAIEPPPTRAQLDGLAAMLGNAPSSLITAGVHA